MINNYNKPYTQDSFAYPPSDVKSNSEQTLRQATSSKAEALFAKFSNFYNMQKENLTNLVNIPNFAMPHFPDIFQISSTKSMKLLRKPATHAEIRNIFNQVYPDLALEGICLGFADVGKRAILSNKLKEFDTTLHELSITIEKCSKKKGSTHLAGKIKRNPSSDISTFFHDISKIYTAPPLLKGETLIGKCVGSYSKPQLKEHLKNLEELILRLKIKTPVVLQTSNTGHTISIGYNPIRRTWDFIDANAVFIQQNKDKEQIADLIFSAFPDSLLDKTTISINSDVICITTQKNAVHYKKTFNTWQNTTEYINLHNIKKLSLYSKNKLLFLASENGHTKIAKMLLDAGANVNRSVNKGATPLFMASQNGHPETVKMQIDAGAAVNKANDDGLTPLLMASQNGHTEIAKRLIDAGAAVNKPSDDGVTPILIASENGHTKIAKMLLDAKAAVNKANDDGLTPLLLASQNGHTEIAKRLLDAGAAVNKPNDNGATPLFRASQHGHTEIAKMLLDAGADVNKAANNGATPLYMASQNGHIEIMKELIEATNRKCKKLSHPSRSL